MRKLSIITICYNEPNLEKTCKSIVEQTNQDFEWVVIDGGSNDETQNVWNKYKSRIDKFVSEKDNGIYNACNKGLRLAEGEYVLFINAGDTLHDKNVIKKIFKYGLFQDVISGKFYIGKKFHSGNYGKITPDFLMIKTLHTPATIIKKDLFDKYGYFDEKYKIVSDHKAFMLFFKNDISYKYIPVLISDFNTFGISSSKEHHGLLLKERNQIIDECYSKEEINKALNSNYVKNSFFENIFSVKNSVKNIHKIITIFGIKLKIYDNKNED